MRQMFSAACKNLHAQFIFQEPYLLTDSWLGGEQTLCRRRHIEVMMSNFPDVSQLLQFQIITPKTPSMKKYRQLPSGSSVLDIKLMFFMH